MVRVGRKGVALSARACVIVMVVLAIPCVAMAQGSWWEHFEYPNGTLPAEVISTGDAADEGAYTVVDNILSHTSSGAAHYIFDWGDVPTIEIDGYGFEVWGANWDFAWRVCGTDPTSGRCLRLSHTDRYGQWAYALSEFAWSLPEASARREAQWTWHTGVDLRVSLYPTEGPADGWQTIEINDDWGRDTVRVKVDDQLIFKEGYERIAFRGYPGFGCSDVDSGAPSLEYIVLWWPCPVESATWGRVKAMYR